MTPEAFAARFDVSRETLDRLQIFAAELGRWNARINLVSRASLADVWQRHMADSAQLLRHVPYSPPTWLDLGSGGGFPGLVVAAMLPGTAVTLVESDQRKAAFLRAAAARIGASITVHACRIEEAPSFAPAIVSARALAPLPRLLGLAARFAGQDTIMLFPKGARAQAELTEAAADWQYHVEQFPSETDPEGCILRITDLRPRHDVP